MNTLFRPPTGSMRLLSVLIERGVDFLRAIAFWIAVVFPLAYVAVLTVPTGAGVEVWGGLLTFHVASLLVGHGHTGNRDRSGVDPGPSR